MRKICSIGLALLFILTTVACSTTGKVNNTLPEHANKTNIQTSDTMSTKASEIDMGKENNTRITIAVNKPENRFIETAALKFHSSNPGIIVEVKNYTDMGEILTQKTENGQTLAMQENTDPWGEKYIKTINTEMMSGAGPDIIDSFYVPCSKFADNGFLTDLSMIIQQDTAFDSNNYYENIIFGNKYKGGLYSMSVGFNVDLLGGRYILPQKDGLTLKDFFKTASEVLKAHGEEGSYVLFDRAQDVFSNLLKRSYTDFIKQDSKECDFTAGEFVQLIEQIKEAADKKVFYQSEKTANSDKNWKNIYTFVLGQSDTYCLADFEKEKASYYTCAIPSLTGEAVISANIYEKYSINNNSKSKGAAWKFIKFLISEEMQTSPELYLFPVNKKAMAERIKRENNTSTDMGLTANDPVFSRISVYPDIDWKICKIIEEETNKYFDGQRTAEDTASIIQGRVKMILKE